MAPRAPELPPYQRPQFLRNASSQSKDSVLSISQSNEADDEQSLSSEPSIDMESNESRPHYDGEDTRLTSDKELRGFYMYGWAAEVLFFHSITTLSHLISNITNFFLWT